jgi:parallel beta-helix repeat protein
VLLEGTYTVDTDNDPVKVDTQNNVTIQGQGKGTKLCLDTGISSNIIEVTNATGITVKDLYIDGTTTAVSGGDNLKQCGIIFITVTDSKIKNLHSLSNKMHGINLTTTSQRNTVTGCICKDNVDSGVFLYSSTYNILWKNILIDNTQHGIASSTNSDSNTIVGNRLKGNGGFGIIIAQSDNNTLTGNTSNGNGNDGIQIWISNYNTVTGNSCCDGGNIGIRLSDVARYNTIFSNTLSGNVMGIYIPNGDWSTIAGNACSNSTPYDGIYATSEGLTISGNTCFNNGDNGIGILVYGMNVLFGNCCCNNTADGVLVYQNLDYNAIVGNTAKGNIGDGIYLYDTNYNTVVSNTSHVNMYFGIDTYASSDNTISSNTSMSNSQKSDDGVEDIRIWGNSDYNNIQKNTCRAGSGAIAPKYGINIRDSNCTENLVTNNDVHNDNYRTGSINIAAGSGTVVTAGNRTA